MTLALLTGFRNPGLSGQLSVRGHPRNRLCRAAGCAPL